MEQPSERLETINYRLQSRYGTFDGIRPNWRVIWSSDEYETRIGEYDVHTDSGLYLRTEVGAKRVPKYNYAKDRWILERLIPVPIYNNAELVTKLSYEPVWVFCDNKEQYLPYKWEAIELVIDTVYKQAAQSVGVKYKDPLEGLSTEELQQLERDRLDKLQKELFGNETEVGDALAYKEGVVVPNKYGEQ